MQSGVFDGLAVPTYFVNQIVAMRTIGPCVELFFGAVCDDAKGLMMPELCLIMPRDCATDAALKTMDFLRAAIASNVLIMRARN